MQENKPILIVGLGNPGKAYENTRHNVGFMAVDQIANSKQQTANSVWKKEHNSLTLKINGKFALCSLLFANSIIFAKPQTFMNLSGVAVQALMAFYKIPLENLIVIHDDMDIKLGQVREKTGGGSAGHNGIKSIDSAVGPNYRRIRIGVGRPPLAIIDPADWVLGKFSDEELKVISNQLSVISNQQTDL
jgi:PTH1 family peptidyl-tRNA hydrolase